MRPELDSKIWGQYGDKPNSNGLSYSSPHNKGHFAGIHVSSKRTQLITLKRHSIWNVSLLRLKSEKKQHVRMCDPRYIRIDVKIC